MNREGFKQLVIRPLELGLVALILVLSITIGLGLMLDQPNLTKVLVALFFLGTPLAVVTRRRWPRVSAVCSSFAAVGVCACGVILLMAALRAPAFDTVALAVLALGFGGWGLAESWRVRFGLRVPAAH
jgi:hypothetical protein